MCSWRRVWRSIIIIVTLFTGIRAGNRKVKVLGHLHMLIFEELKQEQ
jgi:hypothetical protein